MRTRIRDNTEQKKLELVLEDASDRVYVTDGKNEVAFSTSYGQLKIMLPGGRVYHVIDGDLVQTGKKVGVISCHQ